MDFWICQGVKMGKMQPFSAITVHNGSQQLIGESTHAWMVLHTAAVGGEVRAAESLL